jgi:hypothetical protein
MIICACYLFLVASLDCSLLIIFRGRPFSFTTLTLKKFSFDDLIYCSIRVINCWSALLFSIGLNMSPSLSMRYSRVLSSSKMTTLSLLSKIQHFSSSLMSWLEIGRDTYILLLQLTQKFKFKIKIVASMLNLSLLLDVF